MAGVHTIRPSGELDLAAAGPLRAELLALIEAEHPDRLVIDLNDVTFIDSSGLAVLVRARKQQLEHGGDIAVTNAIPRVHRVLKITGLDAAFTPAPDATPDATAG